MSQSTLGQRGRELAAGPNIREKFKTILANPYDADNNPGGFINIGTSENYALLDEVAQFVNKNVKYTALHYSYGEGPWGSRRLRHAMAKHMTKAMKAIEPVDPEDLVFANGVTSICDMLGMLIGDPGDGVLLGRPIYQAFQADFGLKAKLKSVFVPFGDTDQFAPEAVKAYEQAIIDSNKAGTKIRAIMLCNPHNPLGRCYPKETIIEFLKLAQKYQVHLLSDEIYACSVYDVPEKDAVPFTSVLSFDYTEYISPDLLHVIYGLSKDFAAGGLRLGCILMKNQELHKAMGSINQFAWSGGPSDNIAATILESESWLEGFLARARTKLATANQLVKSLLDEKKIKYTGGANAGFFVLIDLSPYLPKDVDTSQDKFAAESRLLQRFIDNGVFMTDGKSLSAETPGYFRIIFSQDERVIREGMRRVFEVIGV